MQMKFTKQMELIQLDLRQSLIRITSRNYNFTGGIFARDRFITCLLAGLRRAALKAVNFEKLHEIVQKKTGKPFSVFRMPHKGNTLIWTLKTQKVSNF